MNAHQKELVLRKIQAIHDRTDWDYVLVELNKILMQAELEFDRKKSLGIENAEFYEQYQEEIEKWKNAPESSSNRLRHLIDTK